MRNGQQDVLPCHCEQNLCLKLHYGAIFVELLTNIMDGTRYYALKAYHEKEGKYTTDIEELKRYSKDPFQMSDDADMVVVLKDNGFEASAILLSFMATVNQERYLVVSNQEGLTGASANGVSTAI